MSWRSLSVLLALVALPSLDADAQDAATAFQHSCGGCHLSVSALARKIKGVNAAERTTYLTAVLKSHHTPDPAVVDQIIAFVLAPPAKQDRSRDSCR